MVGILYQEIWYIYVLIEKSGRIGPDRYNTEKNIAGKSKLLFQNGVEPNATRELTLITLIPCRIGFFLLSLL